MRSIGSKWSNKKWSTTDIKVQMQRDKLFKRTTITKLENDENIYKHQRNKVVQMINKIKANVLATGN